MNARLPLTLNTSVGRRLAVMFVLCAMVPASVLTVDGYRRVRASLVVEGEAQLQQAAKSVGMALMEQLSRAERALLDARSQLGEREAALLGLDGAARVARSVFTSLAIVGDDTARALWGTVPTRRLTAAGLVRLEDGMQVIDVDSATRVVWIVAGYGGSRQVWGALDRAYLFSGVVDRAEVGSFDSAVCIRAVGTVKPLMCASRATSEGLLTSRWNLFLGYRFGSEPWRVEVSVPIETILAPAVGFRATLLLSLITVFGLVVLLTSMAVRRNLEPLEALKAGTRRIAARDFSSPVVVTSRDEFRDLATSFNDMAGEIDQQFRTLSAVSVIDRAALWARGEDDVAVVAADQLHAAVQCAAVDVLLAGDRDRDPWRRVRLSAGAEEVAGVGPPDARDRAGLYAARDRWLIQTGSSFAWIAGTPEDSGTATTALLPLVSHDELVGVVVLRDVSPLPDDRLEVARQLSDQLALGVANKRLIGSLNALSYGAIAALARTVDANSPWTSGHSERVMSLSLCIGRRAGLTERELGTLHRGALLHDIGKIGVPAHLLEMSGELSPKERELMGQHTEFGAKILAPMPAFDDVIPIVRHHHEWFDGSGYPAGLSGNAIPQLARLLAVADVYDATVSDRPYRKGWSSDRAIEAIRSASGTHFDPDFVSAFVDVMKSHGDAARFVPATLDASPVPA